MHSNSIAYTSLPMLSIIMAVFCSDAMAQEDTSGMAHVHGTIVLTSDLDEQVIGGTEGGKTFDALHCIYADPTFEFSQDFSLPVQVALTSEETGVVLARPVRRDAMALLLQPGHVVMIGPHYRWAQLLIGTQVPVASSLATGGIPLFGIGADLHPGIVRLQASAGISQRAAPPDTVHQLSGTYRQTMYCVRVVVGDSARSHMGLSVMHAHDDPGSIPVNPIVTRRLNDTEILTRDSLMDTPRENLVSSVDFCWRILSGLTARGEIAGSLYTRNIEGSADPDLARRYVPLLRHLYTFDSSTTADFAARFSVGYEHESWGADLVTEYVGPAYVSLGLPYLANDHLSLQSGAHASLLDNRLVLDVQGEFWRNNLPWTGSTTTFDLFGSCNAFFQAADDLSFELDVTTDATRTAERFTIPAASTTEGPIPVDTIRWTGMQNLMFSPTYTICGETMSHSISLSLAVARQDMGWDAAGNRMAPALSGVLGALYSVSFETIPLTASLGDTHTLWPAGSGIVWDDRLTAGLQYGRFRDRVVPSLNVTCGFTKPDSGGLTTQLYLSASVRCTITSGILFTLDAALNSVRYPSSADITRNDKYTLRTSLIFTP
ncbi:MAG TPA: hypothetical protein VHI13_11205 [Candidatus Kapabacteria bacterium]|nr:hypothetical protein [Candidatus Kapabacteria bacterium]